MMKRTLYSIICILIACATVGCSTTEKFTVHGQPNTKIYSPDGSYLATIDSSNKAKIEVSSDAYYAFLLSVAPGSNQYIPFALDYEKNSRMANKAILGVGGGIAAIGSFACILGAGMMLAANSNGDEENLDTFGAVVGVGGFLALGGVAIGYPADLRNQQTSWSYQFNYLGNQYTNEDIMFTSATVTPGQGMKSKKSNEIIITPTSPTESKEQPQPQGQKETDSERWKKLFNN